MRGLEACAWPMERAVEALEALARELRQPVPSMATRALPKLFATDRVEAQTRCLENAGAALGLEVEATDAAYGDVDRLIGGAAPALLRIQVGEVPCLLVMRAARRDVVSLIAPDLSTRRVPPGAVRAALCGALDRRLEGEIERLLEEVGVKPSRRRRVRAALLRERLATSSVAIGWMVRLPPGASVRAQSALAHLPSRVAALACAHACAYLLWIASWWIVGRAALLGRLDHGWLAAWALLLVTLIPFELLVTWLQGRIAIDGGALLKRRLLHGALRLEPEEIRHQGAGQLLGRVIEAQAIEALALSGGFFALVATLELTVAAAILATVKASMPALLGVSAAVTGWFAWRFFSERRSWTRSRLAMTHDLVERMVGHRTRIAQEAAETWHDGEDHSLDRYLDASRAMDRSAVWLMAAAPRGWLLVGVLGLSPLFISGSASPQTLAIGIGGILLAYQAFRRFITGVSHLAGAAIAWTEAAPVFHAAARPQPIGSPAFAPAPRPRAATNGDGFLEGHELTYRYRDGGEPVLRGCSLRVGFGDRLLLQGPSGGGKSTLASLLTGLRAPESGLLLLDGVDRQTLGLDGWRRRIVAAPQFHENHVFMGTFAFNLLMGAEWPPGAGDVERAETLCRDLGLGDLLARMPAGLLQQIGETGWQLSHGERSRLFIARALLQDADFVILDESFAQLDPENLQRAMRCVLDRAPTVMLIAHP